MRLDALRRLACRRRLDQVLVCEPADVRAVTGVVCDNAVVTPDAFYTDFRYLPMVRRVLPGTKARDIRRLAEAMPRGAGLRIGYESSIPQSRFLALKKLAPRAKFVDIADDIAALRAVKTPDEIVRVRAAERLDCEIWEEARSRFAPGMTERDMARAIQSLMVARGDGEAFPTIVCVGRNAAECHHEPDDTVWDGRAPVLVDMGVRLDGVCSDLTRNLVPRGADRRYREIYAIVLEANRAAIAAARPGMTGRELDAVARKIIRRAGFGRFFGHSLGHGVGYEVHESPTASRRSRDVLKPGMLVTIEPGIYLEGSLGVRIEDLVLITETGCEVLSDTDK